jgi:hypothetical protein
MFKTILGILGLIEIGTMFLIVFCACIVSSWCDKWDTATGFIYTGIEAMN